MEIDRTLLEQLAVDVFTGMLRIPIRSSPRFLFPDDGLMASIRISGGWEAALEVATPRAGASQIAQEMFGIPEEELGDSERSDALGEIANMIGGNLKGLHPGETVLSLPCVGPLIAQDQGAIACSVLDLQLSQSGAPLTLRLYQLSPFLEGGQLVREPLAMSFTTES